jgi:hypothetical protein
MAIRALRTLPSDGNDAPAHDAGRILFGELDRTTTARCFAGKLQFNAHVLFLFVNSLDECASMRAKDLMRGKEFKCSSGFVFPAKAAWREQAATRC